MSEIDLTAALTRLETAMSALRHRLRDRLGVTGADLTVLQFVARAEATERQVRVKDLATHLGLSGPAVTGTVDRLERAGHLCRVPNPDDGRSRFIELSEDTRRDYAAAMDSTTEHLHELLSSFSERERVKYVRVIDRVIAALDYGAPNS
ncbi:MarR family winged helix-turn-helix transcriptional regulator [Curtobacterium sp. ISL-83]|uniref:MarR family winged helix-turn-helix transcriptional regulator n=1 Tax=Curtobacterium sp. ISL-83 TaxID=2819145 RepID=UPI001BEB7091|nr:MarR family transcriptional regulator [Curtobacterium sp. ISL-83]MBT2501280.1 MarR family transcriptional regulator [Curtobacterium sp. ISL-83]